MSDNWKEFEKAVARLATAFDPKAKVIHDYNEKDRDTGRMRQRDVWIQTTVLQNLPVSILVSCKRLKKKLDVSHIDAFHGEKRSSKAHLGVIYSYSGFTKPAIEKARALGISCCRLYRGMAAEIPGSFRFRAYQRRSDGVRLSISPFPLTGWNIATWGDLLNLILHVDRCDTNVLDELCRRFTKAEKQAIGNDPSFLSLTPLRFRASVVVPPSTAEQVPISVSMLGTWRFYQAKVDGYLMHGSYEFTEDSYVGDISAPVIDTQSVDPGPGWEPLSEIPGKGSSVVIATLFRGDVRAGLLESQGSVEIGDRHGTRKQGIERYREAIESLPAASELTSEDLCTDSFLVCSDHELSVFYVPFEYVNPHARVAIVGITPGQKQMVLAFKAAQEAIRAGDSTEQFYTRIQRAASFAGTMRGNLIAMLDALGVNKHLGIDSICTLFEDRQDLLHSTSAIKDSVFVDGKNYAGHKPKLLAHPLLLQYVEKRLSAELQSMPAALVIPCGKAVEEALEYLSKEGELDLSRCLLGFPHPSGANGHRVSSFAKNRNRMKNVVDRWFTKES